MKIFKWVLTLFFCLVPSLYAAYWNGNALEPEKTKKIGGKTFYVITSAEELAWFAEQVNGGKPEINAVLANNIWFVDDVRETSSTNWTPIGKDSSVIFNGIFDGAGLTIYGLYSNQERFAGIFGVAGKDAVVKNIKTVNSSIVTKFYAGGVVAFNWGIVTNCRDSGSVSFDSDTSVYLGGIAGWNEGAISGCETGGKVSNSTNSQGSSAYLGGVAGWNKGTISGCKNSNSIFSGLNYGKKDSLYLGGITGWNEGDVTDCKNFGYVKFSSGWGVVIDYFGGGIAGRNIGTIGGCLNFGEVSGSDGNYKAKYYLGGIVGWNENTIVDCVNNGWVSDEGGISSYLGGMAGINEGMVSGCTNSGKISAQSISDRRSGGIVGRNVGTISSCMNSGNISDSYISGGIAGENTGSISGCSNSGNVSAAVYYGGIAGDNAGTIGECTNSGLISGSGMGGGGIAGVITSGTIFRCVNNGEVSATGTATGGGVAGGIVGRLEDLGTINDCANNASVSAKDKSAAAGLVAIIETDEAKTRISNSFSTTDAAQAGVTNSIYEYGTVTNCYYDFDVLSGKSTDALNKGLHTSEMQSDSFAWILNTTNGTVKNSGVWSRDSVGYPIFEDSLHKPIYRVVFDDSGVVSTRYTNYKGVVAFPENPAPPAGKKFSGWYTDDNVKVKESTVFTKDQTVYAVYCEPSSCPAEPSDALIANIPSSTWSVTVAGRNFQIHAAPVDKPYAFFDLQGKVLAKGRIESSEMTLSAPRAGSYIVRVGNRSVRVSAM